MLELFGAGKQRCGHGRIVIEARIAAPLGFDQECREITGDR